MESNEEQFGQLTDERISEFQSDNRTCIEEEHSGQKIYSLIGEGEDACRDSGRRGRTVTRDSSKIIQEFRTTSKHRSQVAVACPWRATKNFNEISDLYRRGARTKNYSESHWNNSSKIMKFQEFRTTSKHRSHPSFAGRSRLSVEGLFSLLRSTYSEWNVRLRLLRSTYSEWNIRGIILPYTTQRGLLLVIPHDHFERLGTLLDDLED